MSNVEEYVPAWNTRRTCVWDSCFVRSITALLLMIILFSGCAGSTDPLYTYEPVTYEPVDPQETYEPHDFDSESPVE